MRRSLVVWRASYLVRPIALRSSSPGATGPYVGRFVVSSVTSKQRRRRRRLSVSHDDRHQAAIPLTGSTEIRCDVVRRRLFRTGWVRRVVSSGFRVFSPRPESVPKGCPRAKCWPVRKAGLIFYHLFTDDRQVDFDTRLHGCLTVYLSNPLAVGSFEYLV